MESTTSADPSAHHLFKSSGNFYAPSLMVSVAIDRNGELPEIYGVYMYPIDLIVALAGIEPASKV